MLLGTGNDEATGREMHLRHPKGNTKAHDAEAQRRRRGVGECGSDSVRDLKLQVEQKRNVQRHAQVEVLCSRGSGRYVSDDLILDLISDSPDRPEEDSTVSVKPEA